MTISGLDIFFLFLLLVISLRCVLHGFVDEIFSVASIVCGLVVAFLLVKPGAEYLKNQFHVSVVPEVLAFCALFLITFLVVRFISLILKDIVNRIQLTSLDHILGLVLGLLESFVVISIVLLVLYYQPLIDLSATLNKSMFAQYLLPLISEFPKIAG